MNYLWVTTKNYYRDHDQMNGLKESLGANLWNNCDMTVVVYDVTREETFDAVHKVCSMFMEVLF